MEAKQERKSLNKTQFQVMTSSRVHNRMLTSQTSVVARGEATLQWLFTGKHKIYHLKYTLYPTPDPPPHTRIPIPETRFPKIQVEFVTEFVLYACKTLC